MSEPTYSELLNEYLARKNSEFVQFKFLHYENAGELVAKYRYEPYFIFDKAGGTWENIPDSAIHAEYEYKDPLDFPKFFNQGEFRVRPIRLNTSVYEDFLNEKTEWLDGLTTTPSLRLKHNSVAGTTSLTDDKGSPLQGEFTVYFGEFFLLSNNYKGIKRFNLKTELLQGDLNERGFSRKRGIYSYPDHTAKGMDDSFVKWYFGYSKIPESQRPDFLKVGRITPTVDNMIHTESRRRWMAMRDNCMGWHRIFDKSNLGFDLHHRRDRPTSTICTVKAVVDFEKLRAYLDDKFVHETYQGETENYDIILYPPAMYMYPVDSVVDVIEPVINSINTFTDKILFKAPNNFKTDGNIHYAIDFFTSEGDKDPFYSTSSYLGDPAFEYGRWLKSEDNMKTWQLVSADTPTFDNTFALESGTDAILTTHIKYIPSERLFDLIRDSPVVVFRIKQLDGTRVHYNGRKFSLSYLNEL